MGTLKKEREIRVEPNPDNLYTEAERSQRKFRPLKISKNLQQKLPYMEKPKVLAKLKEQKRVAVIKEPEARKVSELETPTLTESWSCTFDIEI